MPGSVYLASLADAAKDLIVAVLILGALTAVLLRAAYDLGIRAAVQHRWVYDWLHRRQAAGRDGAAGSSEISRYLDDIDARQDLFSLDYRQICGHIASAIQAQLSYPSGDSPMLRILAARADADDFEMLRAPGCSGIASSPGADLIAAARQRVAAMRRKAWTSCRRISAAPGPGSPTTWRSPSASD